MHINASFLHNLALNNNFNDHNKKRKQKQKKENAKMFEVLHD